MPSNNSHLDRHVDIFFEEVGEALGQDQSGIQGKGFGRGFKRGVELMRSATKEKVTIQLAADDKDGHAVVRVWYTDGTGTGVNIFFPTNTLPNILAGFMLSRFRRVEP